MSYSQNNEEELILGALAQMKVTTGRFLDVGAWDGKGFSNTMRLAELGWTGVCVEPSPYVFPKLVENHASRPGIELVNAAVAPATSGLIPWFDSGGDAISTTSKAHKEKWEKGWKTNFCKFWIYVMPFYQLFDSFGFDFDMINIDVEGTNIELFRQLPFPALTKLKILCIEHDNYPVEINQKAATFGFQPLGFNGENVLLARNPQ